MNIMYYFFDFIGLISMYAMQKQFIFLSLLTIAINGKAQFSDDFSDGNFTTDPHWVGDTTNFEINPDNQLHLITSGTAASVLVTSNSKIERAEWNFWSTLSFNTSTNNYARVYLASDNANLRGPLNGYFLQIGGSNDSLVFYKQTGTRLEKLFQGNYTSTNHTVNVLRIKIIHDSAGIWTLSTDNTGGMDYKMEGHCSDTAINSSSWFGILCQYTASNSTKFYFDDFYVGDIRSDSYYQIKQWDVIIDEIMANPNPAHGLPESEYVELFNRTRVPVNLSGWTFVSGSINKTFPSKTIAPHGYLILTKDTEMNGYGPYINLFTSSSTLPNEGTTLVLKNASGKIIHSVIYSTNWYQNQLKESGGWSLEMIDPNNPCGCQNNWKASVDEKGGTPGAQNSVNASHPDTIQPTLKRAWIISDSLIEILFSEAMDSLTLNERNFWYLKENGSYPAKLSIISPMYNSAFLTLSQPLEKKHIYSVCCLKPPTDCSGNLLDTMNQVKIGLTDSILPGDLIINEILANPYTDGEKFIEIYNRSEKILDLQNLMIGSFDSIKNIIIDLKSIIESGFLSFPDNFTVLTKNQSDIQKRYYCPNPDAFVQMTMLPPFNNDNGDVVICRKNDGILIDRVFYSQTMYSDLLTSTNGVSLERINPMINSEEISNWHSASENCGFATPGYQNSEFLKINQNNSMVSIDPLVFTPDDDGKDDVLLIKFTLNNVNYIVNIIIFTANGKQIRYLTKNKVLATEDCIIWDGRDDKNQIASIGIYVLYIELFTTDGKVVRIKKSCVLSGKR